MRAWWEAVPSAFRVARSPRGEVVAFTLLCEFSTRAAGGCSPTIRCASPGAAHLRAHPVPAGERMLLARQTLAWATGAASSPCFAALLRDLERASLEAGPSAAPGLLRRRAATRCCEQLAADRLRGGLGRDLDGLRLPPDRLDLGPESVVGWLSGLAARDLDAASHRPRRGRARTAPRRPPDRALQARMRRDALPAATATASRSRATTLLRDVWGYEWTGGSNVVDVAISGLRRKLGDQAGALRDRPRRRVPLAFSAG